MTSRLACRGNVDPEYLREREEGEEEVGPDEAVGGPVEAGAGQQVHRAEDDQHVDEVTDQRVQARVESSV